MSRPQDLERELTDLYRKMEKCYEPGQSLVDSKEKWTEFFVLKAQLEEVRHQLREVMLPPPSHV